MTSATVKPLPWTLKYLPGVYQEQGSIPQSPLWALLSIIDTFYGEVEEKLKQLPEYFDADTAPLAENADDDFLSWLSHWVVLSLDRDLLTECFPTTEGLEVAINQPVKQRRWRRLIKDAALLYRLRGTPQGLRYMVETFYDVDVEIIERSWPQGMVIGVSSTIEEQTLIIDPPDLPRSFILLIKLSVEEQSAIEFSGNWLDVPYAGEDLVQKGRLQVYAGGKTASEDELALLEKVHKIKQLVDQEKPIHTKCFIAFQSRKPHIELVPIRPYLVIGVQSIIEDFIIDREC